MGKHYIKIDAQSNVIAAFSDEFIRPEQGDVCVNHNGGRHFNLDLKTVDGDWKWNWTGSQIIENEITLSAVKKRKTDAIRVKTGALIRGGFTSVTKGAHFAMELTDQANWTSLMVSLDAVSFPIAIQDSTGLPVSFASKAEVQTCYAEGFARKSALLASDGALETAVAAAPTKAAVDAIVDDRE